MDSIHGENIVFPALLPMGDLAGAPAIPLKRTLNLLGSRPDAHIHMQSHTVSRAHAVIVVEPWGAYIHDLASGAGVIVNGQPIHDADLDDGDEIRIGRFVLGYQEGSLNRLLGPGNPPPAARIRMGERLIPLAQRVTAIGRRTASDLHIDDDAVDPTHALIYVHEGKHILRDLHSRAGVMLNGKRLQKKAMLHNADVIRIGPAALRYMLDNPSAAVESPPTDAISEAIIDAVLAGEPSKDDEEVHPVADPSPEPYLTGRPLHERAEERD